MLLLVALSLVPAGAHLFELPAKMTLPQDGYFTAQQLYRGWSLFGIVLISALIVSVVEAFLLRRDRPAGWFALATVLGLVAVLVIFFLRVYPMNQATANWTSIGADWESQRQRWEHGHAINAIITFFAFCCAIAATLTARR